MGVMDQFGAGYVAPQLQPGEQVRWVGCLMHPIKFNALMMPVQYEHWIGVGTDRRLFAIEGAIEMFALDLRGKMKPEATGRVDVWWFEELGAIRTQSVSVGTGRVFAFDPFTNCGPLQGKARRYDVYSSAAGFDAQASCGAPYMDWLMHTVAQRGFPMHPQKAAQLAPLIQHWEHETRMREAEQARSAAQSKVVGRVAGTVGLIVGWLLSVAIAVGIVMAAQRQVSYWSPLVEKADDLRESNEEILASLEKGKPPPKKCEYKKFDAYKCVCVDETEHAVNNTTNAKRKLNAAVGMWCLDAEGLASEMASHEFFDKQNRKKVSDAEAQILIGEIGGAVAFVVGLFLVVRRLRKAKAPPPGPAHA